MYFVSYKEKPQRVFYSFLEKKKTNKYNTTRLLLHWESIGCFNTECLLGHFCHVLWPVPFIEERKVIKKK